MTSDTGSSTVETVGLAVFAMVVLLAMINGAAGLIGDGGVDAVAGRVDGVGAVEGAGGGDGSPVSAERGAADAEVSAVGAGAGAVAVADDVASSGLAGVVARSSSGVVVPEGWVPVGVGGGCLPGGGSVCVAAEAVLASAAPKIFVDGSAGPAVRAAVRAAVGRLRAVSGVDVSVTDDRGSADAVVNGAGRVELDGVRVWGKTVCSGVVVGASCSGKTVTLDVGIDAGRVDSLAEHELGHVLGLSHSHEHDASSALSVDEWHVGLTGREAQQLRFAYASVFPEVYGAGRSVVLAGVPKPFDVGSFGLDDAFTPTDLSGASFDVGFDVGNATFAPLDVDRGLDFGFGDVSLPELPLVDPASFPTADTFSLSDGVSFPTDLGVTDLPEFAPQLPQLEPAPLPDFVSNPDAGGEQLDIRIDQPVIDIPTSTDPEMPALDALIDGGAPVAPVGVSDLPVGGQWSVYPLDEPLPEFDVSAVADLSEFAFDPDVEIGAVPSPALDALTAGDASVAPVGVSDLPVGGQWSVYPLDEPLPVFDVSAVPDLSEFAFDPDVEIGAVPSPALDALTAGDAPVGVSDLAVDGQSSTGVDAPVVDNPTGGSPLDRIVDTAITNIGADVESSASSAGLGSTAATGIAEAFRFDPSTTPFSFGVSPSTAAPNTITAQTTPNRTPSTPGTAPPTAPGVEQPLPDPADVYGPPAPLHGPPVPDILPSSEEVDSGSAVSNQQLFTALLQGSLGVPAQVASDRPYVGTGQLDTPYQKVGGRLVRDVALFAGVNSPFRTGDPFVDTVIEQAPVFGSIYGPLLFPANSKVRYYFGSQIPNQLAVSNVGTVAWDKYICRKLATPGLSLGSDLAYDGCNVANIAATASASTYGIERVLGTPWSTIHGYVRPAVRQGVIQYLCGRIIADNNNYGGTATRATAAATCGALEIKELWDALNDDEDPPAPSGGVGVIDDGQLLDDPWAGDVGDPTEPLGPPAFPPPTPEPPLLPPGPGGDPNNPQPKLPPGRLGDLDDFRGRLQGSLVQGGVLTETAAQTFNNDPDALLSAFGLSPQEATEALGGVYTPDVGRAVPNAAQVEGLRRQWQGELSAAGVVTGSAAETFNNRVPQLAGYGLTPQLATEMLGGEYSSRSGQRIVGSIVGEGKVGECLDPTCFNWGRINGLVYPDSVVAPSTSGSYTPSSAGGSGGRASGGSRSSGGSGFVSSGNGVGVEEPPRATQPQPQPRRGPSLPSAGDVVRGVGTGLAGVGSVLWWIFTGGQPAPFAPY